jgi:vacuolar protein sorting-associated protein 13A/C
MEEEKKKQQAAQGGGGWLHWMWGGSSSASTDEILGVQMNDQRKKELFEALDYDEKANSVAYEPPKDSLNARVKAKLQKGSLTLRSGQTQSSTDVMSIVFDDLRAKGVQRPTSLDAVISLGDLHVYDGTTPNSQYTEIVRIKKEENTPTQSKLELGTAAVGEDEDKDALLMIKFEQAPLDERADNGLTVKLKSMEVVYHKNYVEAIYTFFKPPETQMESVAALLVRFDSEKLEIMPIGLSRMSPQRHWMVSEALLVLGWNTPCRCTRRLT